MAPGGPARTALARELTGLIAAAPACRGRIVHVAADTAYICTELRGLPAGVTLTGPLPRHASLYEVHPELDYPPARGRRRGRPRTRGARIGTPAQLAAAGPGRTALVTRYGTTAAVTICERRCLWPGVFRSRPVRIIAVTDPGSRLVLLTTDMTTPAGQVITRYVTRASSQLSAPTSARSHVHDLTLATGRWTATPRTVPAGRNHAHNRPVSA